MVPLLARFLGAETISGGLPIGEPSPALPDLPGRWMRAADAGVRKVLRRWQCSRALPHDPVGLAIRQYQKVQRWRTGFARDRGGTRKTMIVALARKR